MPRDLETKISTLGSRTTSGATNCAGAALDLGMREDEIRALLAWGLAVAERHNRGPTCRPVRTRPVPGPRAAERHPASRAVHGTSHLQIADLVMRGPEKPSAGCPRAAAAPAERPDPRRAVARHLHRREVPTSWMGGSRSAALGPPDAAGDRRPAAVRGMRGTQTEARGRSRLAARLTLDDAWLRTTLERNGREAEMCGRTTHDLSWPELHALFGVIGSAEDGSAGPPPNDFRSSWNIAPTTSNPICRLNRDGAREIAILRWGLVPSWAKDLKIGAQCINAVGETVAGKPAFRSAFKSRRCLVPARLFYEWQRTPDPKVKKPYAIGLRSGIADGLRRVVGMVEGPGERARSSRPMRS